MSLRRVIDAGWSPWNVLFFFVPVMSWILILALVVAPSRDLPKLAMGAAAAGSGPAGVLVDLVRPDRAPDPPPDPRAHPQRGDGAGNNPILTQLVPGRDAVRQAAVDVRAPQD